MRVRASILIPILALSSLSQAQSTGLGVKGGLVLSSTKVLYQRPAPLLGGTMGLYFPWGIGPRVELQPELLVTMMGAEFLGKESAQRTLRSVYVQLPFIAKIYLSSAFHFSGGYQFGWLINARELHADDQTNVTDQYRSMDMGFVGGIGLDLRFGVDLSLRAYGGMTRALRNDETLFLKNRSAQFTIGYRFIQLKRKKSFHRRH